MSHTIPDLHLATIPIPTHSIQAAIVILQCHGHLSLPLFHLLIDLFSVIVNQTIVHFAAAPHPADVLSPPLHVMSLCTP
jgi:hypothetical protein